MLVGPAGPANTRYGGGRAAATARSPSASSSNDSVALPTRVISGRVSRRVGRVSDDDFETSSYEETSESSFSDDNSEEYVPLAFGYINDNPRRRAGAPARSQAPTGASEEVNSQSSLSEVSPLEVFFERNNTKRNYGKGARNIEEDEITTSLSSFDDNDDGTSGVSDALPVVFERNKRTRGVGKVSTPTYEISDAESAISLSDEDEAPLNAQLIYTLAKRLRNPFDEVTPEAFDYVDFDDANFREVLEPLKKIKACLERRASYPMKQNEEIDKEIKAAVQSLPTQKAIAAKVQMVKSRQLRPAQPAKSLYRGGESSQQNVDVLPGLVARLQNPQEEVPLSEFEKVDWADRNFEPVLVPLRQIRAYMEAKEAVKAKPAEGAMKGSTALDDGIKTAILSLPTQKEMAAKVQAVKSRQLKAASGQDAARLGGESSPAEVDEARTAAISAPPEKAKEAAVRAVRSRPMSRGQTNGEGILDLIKKLKDPEKQVPLRAFDELEWNDRNFARELEPLQQIRMYMEAKEALKKMPQEKNMSSILALDEKIKTAILALPPEKAVAVKIQMLRERDMAPVANEAQPQNVKLGKMSAPAGTVRKMKDSLLISGREKKSKTKEGKLSASTSQVMQVGAKVISSHHRKDKAKESNALSEPAKTVRRPRHNPNRSVSFLKVEETAPGEIVDQDQMLGEGSGPQRLQDEANESPRAAAEAEAVAATPRSTSRAPSRPKKGPERRSRNHRPGNSAISFSELPQEEADAIKEDDDKLGTTKRKVHRRRSSQKPGRNLSISSLPDLEAGELVEQPELPDKPAARDVARDIDASPANPANPSKPTSHATTTAHGRPMPQQSAPKKKRRVRTTNNNNRSCSFSEVAMDEATEVPDANAGVLKGAAEEPRAARAIGGGAAPPKMVRKLVRRRKPDEEAGTPDVAKSSPKTEKEGEAAVNAAGPVKPPSRKGRRANVQRPRSANTSMVEDEAEGEIVEGNDDVQQIFTPSRKTIPAPEKAMMSRTKDQDLAAATRLPKPRQKSSDASSAPRKRRQRLHASKELSISAIPEDVPGEIVEDERDTFADTAPTGSLASTTRRSLQSNGGGRTFPLMASNDSRRGSMRYGERPNSAVRSSMDANRVGLPPNADPSMMPDAADTSRLPPPQSLRRSAEPAPRTAISVAKSPKATAHIPPLRASR
jgi:hypothetical protein